MILPTDAASFVLHHRGFDGATESVAETIASFAYPTPTWRFAIAAARGEELSLRLVKWLYEQGVPEDDFNIVEEWDHAVTERTAMDEAAKLGYLSVLIYMCDRSDVCVTRNAMEHAVTKGHFEVVKFLNENFSFAPNAELAVSACWNERMEIVKYLHEVMDAPFYTRAFELAAGKGNVELVKYLSSVHDSIPAEDRHEKNVWTAEVMKMAGYNKKMDVVKWLHDNRPERCAAEDFENIAGAHDALPFIKFLHENNCPGDRNVALDNAMKRNIHNIADYLKSLGFTGIAAA